MTASIDERRRAARRGPVLAPVEELRVHHVSTRLSPSELARLDELREMVKMQRGEFLRCAALHRLPPTAPELNVQAWQTMARLISALNQLAHAANRGSDLAPLAAEIASTVRAVQAVRADLLKPAE